VRFIIRECFFICSILIIISWVNEFIVIKFMNIYWLMVNDQQN
jgi:hypothetical protein